MRKAGRGWAAKQGKLRISSDMSRAVLLVALAVAEQQRQEREAILIRLGYPRIDIGDTHAT